MGQYLSFDASVKISKNGDWHSTKADKTGSKRSGKNGIAGIAHYLARAEDLADGLTVNLDDERHECLDLSRTPDNETYVLRDGQLEPCEHSQEIEDAIRQRIEWVDAHSDQPTRDNGCVVRSLVIQFGDTDDPQLWSDAIEYLQERYGQENIIAASIHRDETAPHMHVLFTPVAEAHETAWELVTDKAGNPVYQVDRETGQQVLDEDGQPVQKRRQVRGEVKRDGAGNPLYCFDQKAYFPGPSALAQEHRKFRAALREKGWDIEAENKPIEEQLATWTDKDGQQHAAGLTPEVVGEIKAIRKKGRSLESQQQGLELRAEALGRERAELDNQRAELAQQRQQQLEQQQRLEKEQEQLRKDREQLKADREAQEALAREKENQARETQVQAEKALRMAQRGLQDVKQLRLTVRERQKAEAIQGALEQAGAVTGYQAGGYSLEK